MPMARAEPRASQPIKCESIHIARGARIGDVKVTVMGGARVPVQCVQPGGGGEWNGTRGIRFSARRVASNTVESSRGRCELTAV